jgi:hypothetical protein
MMFANRYESPTPPQKNLPHQPPRISFFISRNNGNIVPLIPADELPYSVRLSGVQRSMRMENTCGMQHVGKLPFTGQYFRLEAETLQQAINTNANHHKINSAISAKQFLAPDAMIRQNTGDSTPSPTTSLPATDQTAIRQLPASTMASTWRRQGDTISAASSSAQATIDAILASEPRPVRSIHTPPGGPSKPSSLSRNGGTNTPESSDKVYCTHWIRHGECDYIQQGCRYKHEMPNKATLQSIGFRTVPRWWQDKVAVQLGQSAIPTVDNAMKPSEWMKLKRKGSDSDESVSDSDDSESDSESDESETESDVEGPEEKNDHEDKLATLAETAKAIVPIPATKPMMKQLAETVTLPASTKTSTEASPIMQALQPVPNTILKSIHKPSLTGSDLIDFSPAASPCATVAPFRSACPSPASCVTATHEPKPQEAKPTPTLPAPAIAITQIEKKQNLTPSPSPFPPRKVFLPAGESKEYHIAHARRSNAPAMSSPEVPAIKFTLGGGQAKEAAAAKQAKHQQRQQARITSTMKKRPTLANFAPGKSGLMASVHAPTNGAARDPTSTPSSTPTSTPTAPPPSPVILSPTSIKQQQQRKLLLQQAKKTKKSGQHGSRSASSSASSTSSPAPGSSNGGSNPKTPEVGSSSNVKKHEDAKPAAKPAAKQTRPAVPDACRPRRPAGQVGKESRPRAKQTAPKVAGEAAKAGN